MINTTDEFKELERQRHYAKLNRVTAMKHARSEEREKQMATVAKTVAGKEARIAQTDTRTNTLAAEKN
jgi:hypothetical protein